MYMVIGLNGLHVFCVQIIKNLYKVLSVMVKTWGVGRKENVYCNQAPSRNKIQSEVQTHGKLNNYNYSLYLKSYSSTNGLYCIQKLSCCRS